MCRVVSVVCWFCQVTWCRVVRVISSLIDQMAIKNIKRKYSASLPLSHSFYLTHPGINEERTLSMADTYTFCRE
ncbi:hypothetical protein F5H01DRAFT_337406 [Linnemannia elongata]|nr:hypothetical protein F5H01DRAFT_337406 [Linnemannia elongata]